MRRRRRDDPGFMETYWKAILLVLSIVSFTVGLYVLARLSLVY